MDMTIVVTYSDGSTMHRFKQLCTSPTHFRNILADELMTRRYSPDSQRLIWEYMPLSKVGENIRHFND